MPYRFRVMALVALFASWYFPLGRVGAEEIYVVREGRLIKKALDWPDMNPVKNPFWQGWVHCGGETVDGLFVVARWEAPQR